MQLSLDNCVRVDTNAKQHGVGDDEVSGMLLIDASGVTVRADLIIIRGGKATTSTSTSAMPPSTTTNIVRQRMLKLSFCPLFLFFHR